MTLIVLAVLAAAWLGYFVLWYRERRASQLTRTGGMGYNRPFTPADHQPALAQPALAAGLGPATRPRGELFEAPRSRRQALSRRRQVALVLGSVAVAALLAVPVAGPSALAVHVVADMALLLFAFGAFRRQQVGAPGMAEVRVLYPQRPAASETVISPLKQVVNG